MVPPARRDHLPIFDATRFIAPIAWVPAGLGWQSLIGAELIVASTGIDFMMVQAQLNISTATVMSSMLAIGVVGFGIDVVLRWIETTVRRHRLA